MNRRTKIVATIGPASADHDTLVAMMRAGMDVARLNFSHGTPEQHAATCARIRTAADTAGRPIAVLQDLPGPKLRIGPLRDGLAELSVGDRITFVGVDGGDDHESDASRMVINWPELAQAIGPGEEMYLADGAVRLRVEAVRPDAGEVDALVRVGGTVTPRAGLNIPGEVDEFPAVFEDDLALLQAGERMGVDIVALSFVQRPQDVEQFRAHTRIPLIAKIEKPQAVERLDTIVEASDCVMVARGDLGIELEIEDVPLVQKRIIAVAGRRARPVITATQMLDSMVASSRPTRAEVTDVFNAILDGTDAVMLSQETAVGSHPVRAVEMMGAIAERAESVAPYEEWNERRVQRDERDPAYTIAHNACEAVRQLNLAALVIPTLSGRSARLVSAHRPQVPIYALSPGKETVRRCSLMWGVQAARMRRHEVTEELIRDAVRRVVELGWVKRGQRIGITAGLPSGRPGTTSLFQVQEA
jgi:pyruvate kinase